MEYIQFIDFAGIVLGLLYLWLEYKASIWLWAVSIIMPIVHGYLYYARGLYADFGMNIYYVVIAVYGYAVWRYGKRRSRTTAESGNVKATVEKEKPITHFKRGAIAPAALTFAALWGIIYWVLTTFTDSTVPALDAFTTSLSMIAMWALAHKYAEQWLLWLVVDAVCTGLYIYKQIPFTAALYAFYTIAAVLGYRKWLHMMREQQAEAEW